MNKTLVIIPTYNEKDNVEAIGKAAVAEAPVDVLFVDDNSPDGTGEIADRMHEEDPRFNVIHRSDKQGLGRAYIAGFKWALERSYDFIFEMDADFSHDPKTIPEFLEAAETSDLVLGTRYRDGIRVVHWPLARLMLSKGAGAYVRAITGLPFSDPTGGFKCFRRGVLETIDLDAVTSNGYSFQIEMTHSAWMQGFKISEVDITFEDRRAGFSKMSKDIVFEALWIVWKLAFRYPFRRTPKIKTHPRSILSQA